MDNKEPIWGEIVDLDEMEVEEMGEPLALQEIDMVLETMPFIKEQPLDSSLSIRSNIRSPQTHIENAGMPVRRVHKKLSRFKFYRQLIPGIGLIIIGSTIGGVALALAGAGTVLLTLVLTAEIDW